MTYFFWLFYHLTTILLIFHSFTSDLLTLELVQLDKKVVDILQVLYFVDFFEFIY